MFNATFERDEASFIYAHVPELPEVQTQGQTLDEAREMVRAAIVQALDLRRERGEPVPGDVERQAGRFYQPHRRIR